MREYGSNINLPSLDNLFSSEQERQDAKLEKIQILPLTELHPFRNHPFQVRDDDEMDKMVDSIKEYGVMTPAIVRPRKDGGYEIVAGHRRCHASQRAGVETMPCIVRDMEYSPARLAAGAKDYELVYKGQMERWETLDSIYSRHNRDDRPNAKIMRSVSVSDIIVTHKDNETHAFYVQPIGYKQVDNLLPELENATPSKAEQHER